MTHVKVQAANQICAVVISRLVGCVKVVSHLIQKSFVRFNFLPTGNHEALPTGFQETFPTSLPENFPTCLLGGMPANLLTKIASQFCEKICWPL